MPTKHMHTFTVHIAYKVFLYVPEFVPFCMQGLVYLAV